MKTQLGCDAELKFHFCKDCKYENDGDGCAEYRRLYSAKVGFEIRG